MRRDAVVQPLQTAPSTSINPTDLSRNLGAGARRLVGGINHFQHGAAVRGLGLCKPVSFAAVLGAARWFRKVGNGPRQRAEAVIIVKPCFPTTQFCWPPFRHPRNP
jgi:hypothetical protein